MFAIDCIIAGASISTRFCIGRFWTFLLPKSSSIRKQSVNVQLIICLHVCLSKQHFDVRSCDDPVISTLMMHENLHITSNNIYNHTSGPHTIQFFFDSSCILLFDLTRLKPWRASASSFSNCWGLLVYSYATAVNATDVNDNVTIIPAKRKLFRKYLINDISNNYAA